MATCEKCGKAGQKLGWDAQASDEFTGQRAANSLQTGHPIPALIGLAFHGAKAMFSNVYYCSNCRRSWRVWG